MGTVREIIQALPSLYPLTEIEEKAIKHMTTKHPVEFIEEGCEDRAELNPICPNCKEYLDSERWNYCPYCGIPIEWE